MMARRWTEQDKQTLRDLLAKRKLAKQIATVLGRTVTAIYHQTRRMELTFKPKPWDATVDVKLRQMCNEGKTVAEMAEAIGLSTRTIYKHLKLLGIKPLPPKWTTAANQRLKEMYLANMSVQQIAELLNCSVVSVNSQVARLKLTRRHPTSKYRGVSWYPARNKWRVSVYATKTGRVLVGRYDDEVQAARAYDSYIKKMGFARPLNFPG